MVTWRECFKKFTIGNMLCCVTKLWSSSSGMTSEYNRLLLFPDQTTRNILFVFLCQPLPTRRINPILFVPFYLHAWTASRRVTEHGMLPLLTKQNNLIHVFSKFIHIVFIARYEGSTVSGEFVLNSTLSTAFGAMTSAHLSFNLKCFQDHEKEKKKIINPWWKPACLQS